MKKKIFISSLLTAVAAFCLTFAFIGAGRSVNADAALKNKDIIMDEGAAIRTQSPMGIRFTAMIKKSVRETASEFGMYVCPADLLGEDGMFPVRKSELKAGLIEGETATSDKFIQKVKVEEGYVIEGTGRYDTFKVALVKIQNKNIDREFSAVAYVVDDKGNEIFSDTVVTRCISDVAKEALADPNNEITDPDAITYLKNIKANSNDFVMRGVDGLEMNESTHHGENGTFSHTVTVNGSKTCTFDLRKKFRNSKAAAVTLKAKASEEGMTVCGKEVPVNDFGSFDFAAVGDKFDLEIAGTGVIYLDDIEISVMTSLGLDGVSLSGTDEAKAQAVLRALPNGNIEYDSKDHGARGGGGLGDLGFAIGKTIPENEYFVFRFKYNADMEGAGRYFQKEVYGDEGLWFYGQDGEYYSTFGDDLKDYTVYKDVEDTPYGSYHGRKGLTTKPDTWYYAVAPNTNDPVLIRHYFTHCHIEISGMYSVPKALKDILFVKKDYAGDDFTALEGTGVRDLGLGVLKKDDGSGIEFETDMNGYKYYSSCGIQWDGSAITFNIPDGQKLSAGEYLVMKFRYGGDNGWDPSEGLWCAFNYDLPNHTNDPWLQVFDEDGYDYTRYNPDNGNASGTYRRDIYSTRPDTWYYMMNRAGNPMSFTVGTTAVQKYTIGGVYAISGNFRDEKFKTGNYRKVLRLPYGSKVIDAGEELTPDIPSVSFAVEQDDLSYVSSDPLVASVSDQGVISGVSAGECDITVSLRGEPDKKGVIRITVEKAGLFERGYGDIREFPLDAPELRGSGGSLIYYPATDTAEYAGGESSGNGNVQFTTGGTVGADEYLVIKFRYYGDMEDNYFHPNVYGDEGLWICGYDYLRADGTSGSGNARDYFFIFDEDYYDYTLYLRKDGDTSYEGNDLTVPYGSFHGTKGLTTKPDTWYYAVAPVKGNYRTVGSYNANLHMEIGGIYAVKQNVRDIFVAGHYPKFINLPYSELRIKEGKSVTPDIAGVSIKNITADNLGYSSSDGSVATVDESGKITAVAAGECNINVYLKNDESLSDSIEVKVLSAASEEFVGEGISASYDLHGVRLIDKPSAPGSIESSGARLEYRDEVDALYYTAGQYSFWGNVQFAPPEGENIAIPEGEYLVIKFRYTKYQYFDEDPAYEGLLIKGYGNAACTAEDNGCYFSIFDEDGYDYTIYSFAGIGENSQFPASDPCGSYHTAGSGIYTVPDTWYYAVASLAGNYTGIGSVNNWTDIEIEGIYSITAAAKAREFQPGNYPDALLRPAEFAPDGVKTFDLSAVRSAGNKAETKEGKLTLGYNAPLNRLMYKSGDYCKTDIGFGLGTQENTVGENDYVVFKFRYFDDMYFLPNGYSDEGLWFEKYFEVKPESGQPEGGSGEAGTEPGTGPGEGGGETGTEPEAELKKEYFSIFDEEYKDYTIYQHDTDNTPYGSYHGSNGITTEPGKWYFAVAPGPGPFSFISSYNKSVHIEIAGIYAISGETKEDLFKPNVRPSYITGKVQVPYTEHTICEGQTEALDVPGASFGITLEELDFSSSDLNIATVDENGNMTGTGGGTCDITVALKEDDTNRATVRLTVLPAPVKFKGIDLSQPDTGISAAFDLAKLELIGGKVELAKGSGAHINETFFGVDFYSASYGFEDCQFSLGQGVTVPDEEYLVIIFKYNEDMEEEGKKYFGPDAYSDEGLWIKGYGNTNTHPKYYFSTFDEDYFDYTLYMRKDGDTSYEGNDTTVPYGSFHRADLITTKPGTWYYAVAPVPGNFTAISGYNNYLHAEIAGIYSITKAKKEALFKPQHYPAAIAVHRDEMSVLNGEERGISNFVTVKYADKCTEANVSYSSDNTAIATVDAQGVVKGAAAGDCTVTVTVAYRNDNESEYMTVSKGITVHVLPVPASDDGELPQGITSLGTDCITADKNACRAGNMVHYAVYAVTGDSGTVSLDPNIDIADDEYLVFKAMYTSDMRFIDDADNEGIWFLGHRDDAVYNAYYDYFSVIGKKDGVYTDYTIYNSAGLPYGSYHNFSKHLTTEPHTWYYLVALQPGKYADFCSYLKDADMIIGGVYKMSEEFYSEHVAKNAALPLLAPRLETVNPSDEGKLRRRALRERIYAANTDASNEFRLAAEVPDDRYIRFEINNGNTDLNSLNFIAARGRTYYYFGAFGTDGTDYGIYRDDDVMQGVCGIQNTETNNSYYLIAPVKGNFDWFALRGNGIDFNVTVKDVSLIDEETRNGYVAIATNNRAAAYENADPVITFGVFGGSHIPGNQVSDTDSICNGEKNFKAALEYFKSQDINTLLLNGDIIDCTAQNGNSDNRGTGYNKMNEIMDEVWGKYRLEAPEHLMYTLGDHEYYYTIAEEDVWTEWEKAGYTRWQSFEANGYTFISLDISAHDGKIDSATRTVMQKRLEKASAADSSKPIFVTLHIPPKESIPNTSGIVLQDDDNTWIQGILETYPQTVMFCSGTGYSIRSPQSINQNKATVINTGPGTYGCVPQYIPEYDPAAPEAYHNALHEMAYAGDIYEEGTITGNYSSLPYAEGYKDLCTGLVVKVYAADNAQKPNTVEIERVNLLTGQKIGTDWSFTATGQSSGFVYTKEKQKTHYNDFMPQLSADSCSVAWNEGGDSLVFNLKPSNTESMGDNIADCYQIKIFKTDGEENALYTKNYVSDYWLTNGYGELKDFKMFVKEENRNQAFTVKVKALDAYGRESNELTFELSAPSAS